MAGDVAPEQPTERCTHCPAQITWAITVNGRRMPLDATPTDNGNVGLWWNPCTGVWCAAVGTRDGYATGGEPYTRHVHHVMTCPRAAEWNPAAAKARGAKPDQRGRPGGREKARPVQEEMF